MVAAEPTPAEQTPAEPARVEPAIPEGAEPMQVALAAVELKRRLLAMRRVVEENCEHVGDKFAEKARAMHDGEEDARGIYGQATPDELEALKDDGIEVGQIPWVREDA